jgi:hypothetical protein
MAETTIMTTNDPADSDAPRHAPVRLTRPRAEAQQALRNQMKIGVAIKDQRIRNHWDLDQARSEKQEWVNRTAELLTTLFSDSSMLESFNDWLGTVLPEYAEFEMFVEQFVQEMKQRLARLQSILRMSETVREPIAVIPPPPAPEVPPARPVPPAPPVTAAAPDTTPQVPPAESRTGLLLARCGDPNARQGVVEFAQKLGLEVSVIGAEQDSSVANELSCHEDSAAFVIVLADATAIESGPFLFEVGCCVGRLGAARVCVLQLPPGAGASNPNEPTTLERLGVRRLVVDSTGESWHLALARHLRAAGAEVDLNRLV